MTNEELVARFQSGEDVFEELYEKNKGYILNKASEYSLKSLYERDDLISYFSYLLYRCAQLYNTDAQNASAKYPLLTATNATSIYSGSTFWLFNGAYMRIKNISLGYTIPSRITKKFFVESLRVYLNINDLPAFSNYPKGWDPECTSGSDFIMTSYSLGVNVTF